MNDYLAQVPFDVYELNLFQLVAECASFTKAGERAGLTQSVITRQVRGMEERLGAELFERTTRRVSLTAAGKLLFQRSVSILEQVSGTIRELREHCQLSPQVINVGVSRSIGLAYLPGFFFTFQKRHPKIQIRMAHEASEEILRQVESGMLDAGLLCPPPRLLLAPV